jgi:hypothetical protein
MNLSEFVEETLSEVLAGIRAAQTKEGGNNIAAEMYGDASAQGIISAGQPPKECRAGQNWVR